MLVIQFQNKSPYADLNWVGESIADTLMSELAATNEIVLTRGERDEGEKQLELRSGADYTKASLLRLGESLGADMVCFGTFSDTLPRPDAPLKSSSIRITAQFLDLQKMHLGPELSEAGPLSDLSRLEEHLAFEVLKYLKPGGDLKLESFLAPTKLVKLEAEESYVRGLLSTNRDQRQKWFLQAAAVDNKFSGPALELGKLALEQKQYAQALEYFGRINRTDPSYMEARFKMGLAAYSSGDYAGAVRNFREVSQGYPLSEVYNNLGASELQANDPGGMADLRRALESDPRSVTYLYNLGWAQLKTGSYDEASKTFQQILQHSDDADSRALAERARRHEPVTEAEKIPGLRLKAGFSQTAFRQLKAMLQPKGS